MRRSCRPAETVQEYMDVLKQYPIVPKPEIFGLHDNADITCDQNETYDLFATVLSLQPRVSAGVGASREDIIMAKCEGISAKLPAGFDVEAVQQKYPTMYEESMNTVLAQECIRYIHFCLLSPSLRTVLAGNRSGFLCPRCDGQLHVRIRQNRS